MSETRPPICDYEGSDYQERFWELGEREYEDRVEAVALSRLLPDTGDRLLEVGAGAGRHTPRYQGFRKIVLLDYSRTQLEQAQSRLGISERYLYVAGDVYRLPFAPGVFDAATMIRTLHHMTDPLAALRQVRFTMVTSGVFVLEYANKRNMKAIARWALRRQAWNPFGEEPVEFVALNYNFHPVAVRGWMSGAGFKVVRQLTVSHFRLNLLKKVIPLEVLVALDSLIQWTGNWIQLTPSVFLSAEAVGEGEPSPAGVFWRCPVCGSFDLENISVGIRCGGCERVWPLREGIFDFKEPLAG
ncbi:MAG: methyltransferase domain-containing protein [Deltaproteobacteria bacterium]|nr:methyltransferase domain-containing protein [Deltaproteobacteria bacterium]